MWSIREIYFYQAEVLLFAFFLLVVLDILSQSFINKLFFYC